MTFVVFKEICTVYYRRSGICRVGASLAGAQSQQYVFCRRQLLSAIGETGSADGKSADLSPGNCRCRSGDRGGTGGRTLGKPGVYCLGLSGYAAECKGAYLLALFPCLGAGELGRDVFIPQTQLAVVFALQVCYDKEN